MDENAKEQRRLDTGSQRDVERQDNEGQTSQAMDHQIQRSIPLQCTGTTIQGSNIVNSNVIMNSGPVTITNQSIVENVNIDELCKDLEKRLVEATKNASETIDPVVDLDHSIDWVSLEIAESNEPSITNETTHHHRREDFQKMYKTIEGNLSLEQLWPLAQQEAKNEAEIKCKTESAKQDYIRKHGNVVGILGEAGIGKTTLSKILVQKVLKEKSQMYDCQCQYIFYIPVRNMDFKTETFFLPLLLSSASCEYSSHIKEEKIRDKVLDKLDNNPNVVIILDGLDEADINFVSQPSNISKYAKSTAEYFIKNILQGKLLPDAKKYVTSRPRQFYDLHNECRPRFKANILGLSKESQHKLCKEICGESYSDVLTYLQNHPDIFAYCYVPVNCQLVCFCIHQFLSSGGDQLSRCTMSKIMTSAFSLFLDSSHFRENLNSEEMQKELKKIPALAWYGFVNKMLLFKKGDLKKNGININKVLDCFLHSFVDGKRSNLRFKVIEGKKVFFFSHMIWQEFLSAMHLILFMPLEDFQQHLHEFGSSWWQMVTKFMFGILCQDVCEQLEEIFPTMFAPNDDEIARKMAYLKNFTSKYLEDSMKRSFDLKSFLQLCTLVYEFQNEDLTPEIAEKLPTMIAIGGDLLPSDITSFHYVLSKRKNSIDLKFHVNSIEDSFQHFFEKMSSIGSILMISAVSCNKGNLDLTKMQSLVKCLDKITCLILNGCDISENAAECLAEGLCKLSAPISELYLARTKIGDTGAQYLSNCLRKIKKLYLAENVITANGAEFISEGLKPLKQPMTCLDISCNSIGDKGASFVASSLSKVEQLAVKGCGFTEKGVKAFADALKDTTMKKLELSYQDPLKASHRLITISCDMEILLKKTSYHRDRITGVGVELIY
ncbi:NACHT, LRR and PYD domains-containing protein 3-like isoform X1 [Clavelina lepadiformis]|uniref:NACHT, LRR and PYD domains-containing protein 3-like isoform X1 n=1 Tax=Clavelina lepadiformis TaxID=159417 RepID=UPI004042586D